MSWKDDITKFQSPHSKILYMIYHFSKLNELTDDQRTKLKEYVILEDDKIFEILTEFESSLDENNLLLEMKRLYEEELKFFFQENCNAEGEDQNGEKSSSSGNIITLKKPLSVNTDKSFLNNAMNSIKKRESFSPLEVNKDIITEMNSPMGNTLLNRKKKQQSQFTNKVKENLNSSNFSRKEEGSRVENEQPKKHEIYQTSILGHAVGNLEEN